MNCRVRTWRVSGKRAVTGWWPQLNRNGSANEQFEEQEGWREILREPSPRNEGQQKMRVLLKPAHSPDGSQSVALCWSQGRTEKDVLFIKGRRSVFWPTFKSCASAAQREARRLNSLCRVARFVLTWAEFRPQSFATSYPLYAEQAPNRSEWERS